MKELAEREGIDAKALEQELKAGRAVVLKHAKNPIVLNRFCSTKINANLGTSMQSSPEAELKKASVAIEHGTDTIMDLSTRDTVHSLKRIISASRVPVGSVPIYSCFPSPTEDDFLKAIEAHAKAGASFVTVHSAITRGSAEKAMNRITKIVSRGGGIIAKYMKENSAENPLYRNFDKVLEICKNADCAISLGDALRAGSLADANDEAMLAELKLQGEQVLKARKEGVQVFCEGPGHMPFDTIAKNVALQKEWCHYAPYYVLGPLVTDRALGYDHLNAAIGATAAAVAGAEFLCAVTPSEHFALPTVEDIKEGVIAFKIAAHAADVVKLGRREKDDEMSRARYALDWRKQEELSITKKKINCASNKPCTMCGELCPMKIVSELDGESNETNRKGRGESKLCDRCVGHRSLPTARAKGKTKVAIGAPVHQSLAPAPPGATVGNCAR
ncbi:phosphomethylpyrimidine synthase ThiC [Candidatus Micrarchaeota archaeon]|nr:phosphomethylpyrimidine synthase ThiC [Candidatus Micrarchaeota archaeon]